WERSFRNWSYKESHTWELVFNDTIAICRWIKPKEEDKSTGAVQVYKWQRDVEDIYVTHIAEKKVEDAVDFMRKMFQIDGDFPKYRWKMTGKQGLVEEFPCMEAMTTDGLDTIYAWFSPRMQLPIGPREFRGLPGAVLYLEADGGNRKISIESIDLSYQPTEADLAFSRPKGKSITYEEFIPFRREKMQEMRDMYGR
ncbi:MAG: GLPGLI family protein, partial [Cryomorphaceae bacterium]|nr:GLPGLI family protein [Cryomorphaceae bacterium]